MADPAPPARWRRSFRLRLVLGALVWIGLGLALCGGALYAVMRTHLLAEIEEELGHHGGELAAMVVQGPGGALGLRTEMSDHRFAAPGSGYYWQVEGAGVLLRSPSLGAFRLSPGPAEALHEGAGPEGAVRQLDRAVVPAGGSAPVRISVAIGEDQVAVLLRGFARSLALSLALVAAGLMAAVVAQVTYGLQPLTRIRAGLAAIRRGEQDRLPDDLPLEVQPLATSLNEMIRANDEVVQRARTQAGNLAHALKTPLAILIDEAHRLQAAGQDGSVVLREAERMRRQIDYQLAQARAAASRGRPRTATPVVPAVREIVAAVSRMHRERDLDFALEAAGKDAVAAVEAEDLDELLGNVIENAAKFARHRVAVSVASHGGRLLVHVDDDGPGLPEAAREAVFRVGQRLDEGVPGHGLGLAIVRDIAALYGGRVAIGTSPLGGARVILELPQAG